MSGNEGESEWICWRQVTAFFGPGCQDSGPGTSEEGRESEASGDSMGTMQSLSDREDFRRLPDI